MLFNNKTILPAINNLADLLNSSRNSIDQDSEVNSLSDENNLPAKTIICQSNTPISWHSKKL